MTKILHQIKNVVVTSLSKAIIVVSLFATLGMVYAQLEPVVVVQAQSAEASTIAEQTASLLYQTALSQGKTKQEAQNISDTTRSGLIAVYQTAYASAKTAKKTDAQAEKSAIEEENKAAQKLIAAANGAATAQQDAGGTKKTNTTTTQNGDAGGFVPCGNEATNPCQIGHLFSAFVVIINYLIAMAGFIAVIAIVYAGFMMVYSQGQEQLKAAKGRISGAVIGLVLVAAAFIIINAIFAGSLSIGVKSGGSILSSPLDYIQNGGK